MTSQNEHGPLIEPKLKALDAKLKGLNIPENLFKIIHQPGYTTLVHLLFINNLIDTIGKHADMLKSQINILHEGSQKIVNEK